MNFFQRKLRFRNRPAGKPSNACEVQWKSPRLELVQRVYLTAKTSGRNETLWESGVGVSPLKKGGSQRWRAIVSYVKAIFLIKFPNTLGVQFKMKPISVYTRALRSRVYTRSARGTLSRAHTRPRNYIFARESAWLSSSGLSKHNQKSISNAGVSPRTRYAPSRFP